MIGFEYTCSNISALPPSLQSQYGLLAGEQGGELLELPLLSPRVNRLFLQGKLVLEGGASAAT